ESSLVAWARLPTATDCRPLAFARMPLAVELSPEAVAPWPVAVASRPEAMAPLPSAVELSPLAVAAIPHSVDSAPVPTLQSTVASAWAGEASAIAAPPAEASSASLNLCVMIFLLWGLVGDSPGAVRCCRGKGLTGAVGSAGQKSLEMCAGLGPLGLTVEQFGRQRVAVGVAAVAGIEVLRVDVEDLLGVTEVLHSAARAVDAVDRRARIVIET